MTRRRFLSIALAPTGLVVPVHHVVDVRANPEYVHRFFSRVWPQAVRDFERCPIRLKATRTKGEIWPAPAGRPIFTGLRRDAVNLVLTDRVPLDWDQGRALAGLTTRYEGHHLCVIAVQYAHGHMIPFVAVNTCVHELLHVLMNDISESRPGGIEGQVREARIDFYATRLWLFGDGSAIRRAARHYLSSAQFSSASDRRT